MMSRISAVVQSWRMGSGIAGGELAKESSFSVFDHIADRQKSEFLLIPEPGCVSNALLSSTQICLTLDIQVCILQYTFINTPNIFSESVNFAGAECP
jgi:hypothetical protein